MDSPSPNYSMPFKCLALMGLLIIPIVILMGQVPLLGVIFLAVPWYIIMLRARNSNEQHRLVASGTIFSVQIIYISICWIMTQGGDHTANIGLGLVTVCLPLAYVIALTIATFITLLITSYRNNRLHSH